MTKTSNLKKNLNIVNNKEDVHGIIFERICAKALKDLKGKNTVERYARRLYLLLMFSFISIKVNVTTLPYSCETEYC